MGEFSISTGELSKYFNQYFDVSKYYIDNNLNCVRLRMSSLAVVDNHNDNFTVNLEYCGTSDYFLDFKLNEFVNSNNSLSREEYLELLVLNIADNYLMRLFNSFIVLSNSFIDEISIYSNLNSDSDTFDEYVLKIIYQAVSIINNLDLQDLKAKIRTNGCNIEVSYHNIYSVTTEYQIVTFLNDYGASETNFKDLPFTYEQLLKDIVQFVLRGLLYDMQREFGL